MPIYEFECRSCMSQWEGYYSLPNDEATAECPKCHGIGDKLYSLSHTKVFQVFTTRNILPEGQSVTVRGPGQLRQLEADHGVKMADADGPPPRTIQPITG